MKKVLLSLSLLVATFTTKAQIGPCSGTPVPLFAPQYLPACAGHNDTIFANPFLNEGLVAYYPFNGNANDLSGNGYNATANGVTLAADRFGNPNKCYNFNGTSTYVQCPAATYFTGGDYTLSGWVNVSSLGSWARMIDFGNGAGANNVLLALSAGGSNQIDMNNSNNINFTSSQVIDFNAWVQVLFTYNATTGVVTCYYNGVAIDQSTLPAPDNVVRTNCYIGLSNWGSDGGVFGLMDDIRIYNRELSGTEVTQLYNYESTGESQTAYSWSGGSTLPYLVSNSPTPTTVTYTLTQTRDGASCSAADTIRVNTINCTAALNFDGADDYVSIASKPALDNLGSTAVTLEAWIYIANNGTNSIVRKSGDYNFYVNNNIIAAEVWTNGIGDPTWMVINGSTTIPNNTWTHVAFTWDNTSSTAALYVNGMAETINSSSGSVATVEPLNLGASSTYGNYLTGSLDEVRLWNVARTQAQIQKDMGCMSASTPAGLLAYYNFDQGVPNQNNAGTTTLTDITGNGNDGTLMNFALNGTTSNWVDDAGQGGSIPTITSVVTSNTLVCAGTTVTLTVNGTGSSFTWGANAGNATTTTVNVSPVSSATYIVTAANGLCRVMDSVSVAVNPLPNVTITTHTIVCAGTRDTLFASGATSYTWTPTGSHATSISGILNTTRTFTLTGIDANNCINEAVLTVTVNPLPSVGALATNSVVCAGNSTTLSGTGADTYTWTGGVFDTTPFNPVVTTTYTVTGTDANGCTNTNIKTITVNPLPNVTASATNTVICAGGSTTLMGGGATTYTWTGGVTDNTAFNPLATNTYSVTGTDANGCTNASAAVVSVTVNPLPNVTASASNSVICAGDATTLMGSGADIYNWTGGVINNTPFNPTTTATYTVSGTENVNNCTSTAVISVTVNPLPNVTVNSASICIGATTTLTASGADTYTWSTTDMTTSIAVTPTANATYTVNATDVNGCMNMTTADVTVNSLPNVTANSATVCAGATATLTASGADTYTWSTTDMTTSIAVTPTANVTYSVNATDVNGCMNMATADVTVNSLPTINASANPTMGLCSGQTATLTASGADTYTWSTSDIGATAVVSPTTTATFTVSGTENVNNCTNMAVISVTVNPLPTIAVNNATVCAGATATLTASGANTYTWSTTATTPSVAVTTTTNATYTVNATDLNGCMNMATANVTVNSLPAISVTTTTANLCTGQTATLTASGATTYTWSTSASGATTVVSPTITATYTVMGTDGNGCDNMTTFTQTVSVCMGIEQYATNGNINVYPNPSTGLYNIVLDTDAQLIVTNALGEVVLSKTVNAGTNAIDVQNQLAGVYFVRVIQHTNQQIIKLIKN